MTRGHEPVLAARHVKRLESYEHRLIRLEMPELTRQIVAGALRDSVVEAVDIYLAQITAIYVARTGRVPQRVEREQRRAAPIVNLTRYRQRRLGTRMARQAKRSA